MNQNQETNLRSRCGNAAYCIQQGLHMKDATALLPIQSGIEEEVCLAWVKVFCGDDRPFEDTKRIVKAIREVMSDIGNSATGVVVTVSLSLDKQAYVICVKPAPEF